MATSYKQMLIDVAPPFMRNQHGEAWLRGTGDVVDELLDKTKESVKARFPLIAPKDALELLGAERGIVRTPGESDATYAVRVKGAWDAWPWAGTATGVLNALWDAGYQMPWLVIAKGLSYSLNGSKQLVITTIPAGSWFVGPIGYWSGFIVYFPTMPAAWSGTPPSGSSDEAKFIMNLVKRWKSAHARFDAVIIQGSGILWGLPFANTWGGSGLTWGGSSTVWTPTP